jgi:two-component system chemotaxis sensor kinase CheA
MDQFQAKFIEEANDLIATLEKTLLELESKPEDRTLVEKVFRVMHTLKGNSSMFGFEKMGAVTHHLETIYDFVREGKRVVSKELLTLTFASLDHFKTLLTDPNLSTEESHQTHGHIMAQIDKLINQSASVEKLTAEQETKELTDTKAVKTFYILFKPNKDILTNGTNPLYLLDELHALGTCKVYPQIADVPSLEEFNPSECYTYWNIFLSTEGDTNAIKDVFIFVEEDCLLEIHTIADDNLLGNEEFIQKIQSIQNDINVAQLVSFANQPQKKNSTQLNTSKETQPAKAEVANSNKEQAISSIRVSSEKLDDLMNLVSELVTTQARLSLFAETNTLPELMTIAENVEKISRQLRDNTFSICLIPLESMLVRFQRLVRDLSTELGKDIILVTEGADTELDKSIIESLADPLLHILRNSIDHGIEDTAVRQQKGKPKQGRILLKAFYSGTNVHIQIQDDGAGIDPRKIREKAISKGIISAEAQLSEKEILDLIFLPGFSTAAKVTDVSGRGVGMDVVRRKIAEIRGEVEIKSQLGIGTTITIKLPVTLSIMMVCW